MFQSVYREARKNVLKAKYKLQETFFVPLITFLRLLVYSLKIYFLFLMNLSSDFPVLT